MLLKKVSFLLLCIATLLLILDIVDIKMVFGRNETGLLDNLPGFVRQTLFIGYPVCLVVAYILSIRTKKLRTRIDPFAKILFLLHGLAILTLFVIFLKELAKNL